MNISWVKLLAGALAVATTVAGATFTLTKFAKEAEIAACRLALEMQDRRIAELQQRLNERNAQKPQIPLPNSGRLHDQKPEPISVRILSPLKAVPQFGDVTFALTGNLPVGFKPQLVVCDPFGKWWSWGTTDSSTFYSIQFGADLDRGKQFEIRIIVTDEYFPPNQPRRSLPTAIASDSVVVTRQ